LAVKTFKLVSSFRNAKAAVTSIKKQAASEDKANPTCGLKLDACCVGPRNRKLQASMGWGVAPLENHFIKPGATQLFRMNIEFIWSKANGIFKDFPEILFVSYRNFPFVGLHVRLAYFQKASRH